MLETISSAETAFDAVVGILTEVNSRRREILPLTRDAWKTRNRRMNRYRAWADENGAGVDFDSERAWFVAVFDELRQAGVSEVDAGREVAVLIDHSFGYSFAFMLPKYYSKARGTAEGVDGVFRLRAGDPVCCAAAFGKPEHASDHDEVRTGGVRLAPAETDLYNVEISFELSHLALALSDPDLWRPGIVQPMSPDKSDWVEGAAAFRAAPAPIESEEYRTRLFTLLEMAAADDATFAVMAEGVVSDALVAGISEHAAAGSVSSLAFAVTGSRYTPIEADEPTGLEPLHQNVAEIVTYAQSPIVPPGTRLLAARKNRRSFDGLEPIEAQPDEPFIKIFCLGDLKLAVVICADFSEPRIRAFLSTLGVELVAVPALTLRSENTLEFARQASSYALDTGAAVVLANSSSPGRRCEVAGAVASSANSMPVSWRSAAAIAQGSDDVDGEDVPAPTKTEVLSSQLSAFGVTLVDNEFSCVFGNSEDAPSTPGVAVVSMSSETHSWLQIDRAPSLAIDA